MMKNQFMIKITQSLDVKSKMSNNNPRITKSWFNISTIQGDALEMLKLEISSKSSDQMSKKFMMKKLETICFCGMAQDYPTL